MLWLSAWQRALAASVEPISGSSVPAWLIVLLLFGLIVLFWQRWMFRRRTAKLSTRVEGQAADVLANRRLYERELWINQLVQHANYYRDPEALASYVVKQLSRALPVARVAIFLAAKEGAELKLVGVGSRGENMALPPERLQFQGVAQEAFTRREPCRENLPARGAAERMAHLALPLRSAGRISGAMLLEELRLGQEASEEIHLAERVAEVAGVLIGNAQTLFELDQRAQGWEKSFVETWTALEKILAGITDPAFIHSPDYTILHFNEAFQRRVGRPASRLLGQKCYDVLFHKSAPCSYCPYRAEESQAAAHTVEVPQTAEQSSVRILSLSRVQADGKNLGAVEVVRDSGVELRLQEQLLHSEKLASIGKLVSGVAHELNNPLTAILGHAQLLDRRAEDPRVREKVQMILDEAGRASKIVRNLLTFARKHRPEQQIIDLNEVIQKTLSLREYELKTNNIDVAMHLAPRLPAVVGDLQQLQQVLLNLISNAEHAMIDTHGQGILTVESSFENGRVCLKVRDDGPGIPPEIRQRIFDPFFTTKPIGKGTGLGLSICFGILTEHKGSITVDSEVGHGATFTVALPVAGERAEELAIEQPSQPFLLPRKRVLISSNDTGVCDALEDMLKPAGALIEFESSSEQSLAKCLAGGYDLILAEWSMPGEDRLVDWLREDRPQLTSRCILLTTRSTREDVEKFCEVTGASFLQKPVMFAELRITVERVLRHAFTVSERGSKS